MELLTPVLWFAGLGLAFGLLLALASKLFAVRVDERIPQIAEKLPGANCGGCGYSGCSAYAEAVVRGEAKPNKCAVGGAETAAAVSEIMGVKSEGVLRMRAQVMCSGTSDLQKKILLCRPRMTGVAVQSSAGETSSAQRLYRARHCAPLPSGL